MSARRSALLCLLFVGALSGCHKLDLFPLYDREKAEDKQRRENVRAALRGEDDHSKVLGDYVRFGNGQYIKVQGVGVVDRLDGTGEDPPASHLRTTLLNDLRRHEIEDPQTYLSSAKTALVVVTAYIPPICRKNDKIDVEITLPDGSEATSLAGGWLMPCYLREHMLMQGEVHEGNEIAVASGAVIVDALGDDQSTAAGAHRRGRIPGAATYLGDDRVLGIGIRSEYRTVRMSSLIAERIGKRFHDYNEHGIRRPMAEAKTDAYIELMVPERYRDNYPRYLQCIRAMTLTESPVDRHLRLEQLVEEIQFGPTAERASLQLEAIGAEAIPTLKKGLTSEDLEARFHAGVALAYLGNADGVPALQEAADKEPAFRIFALAALATLEDGSAANALRELMNHQSVETRYGAFRAYSTMAPEDPFVRGAEMAGHFWLHPIASTGQPLIHLTRYKKAEIVLFGAHQKFLLPLMLRAGKQIIVQGAPQGDGIIVKRIAPDEPVRERKVSCEIGEVIQAASELGANYPDVVEMLVEADRQHNLPGQIAIDELPQPGRVYARPRGGNATDDESAADSDTDSVTVGSEGMLPNLFDEAPPQSGVANPDEAIPTKPENVLLKN